MSDPAPFQPTPKPVRILLFAILALGFVARLFFLAGPIADDQSWNQCSAATVARHFTEEGINFFYPQWDVLHRDSAEKRIEAEEAPIYHSIVAVLSHLGGEMEAWARLVSLIFGTLAGLYFFRLVRGKTDDATALAGTFFFVFAPLTFFFFRTIGSDPAMIFSMIAALFYFDRYLSSEGWADLLLASVFTAFAGLFKPFGLQIGVTIVWMAWMKYGPRFALSPRLWLMGVISLLPTILWIAWAAKIGSLGGVTDGQSVAEAPHLWGKWSLLWNPSWYFRLQWRLFDRMATPVVSVLALAALVIGEGRKRSGFLLAWLAGVVFYILTVRSGNQGHNYYQLPAVAPFSALAAVGLFALLEKFDKLPKKPVLFGVLALYAILAVIYVIPHFNQDLSSVIGGQMAREITQPGDKILVMDPGATRKNQAIYASGRQGWHFQHLKVPTIKEYKELGAKAVVLVLEPSQMKKAEEAIEYLHANAQEAGFRKGDFNHRSKKPYHEIYVYRLNP